MKYFYQLLLLLSCLPAGAQSLYEFAIVRTAN